MKPKVLNALNKQVNAEFYASYLYLAMGADFESKNLKGFAGWMKAQSDEERGHAMRIYNHIIERGQKVTLDAIPKPPMTWKTPLEAFQAAYEHEVKVTKMIHDLVKLAHKEMDLAAMNMLQWFVAEQVEEEDQTNEIVEKLKMIKGLQGALFMLDAELGKRKSGGE